MSAPSTKVWSC